MKVRQWEENIGTLKQGAESVKPHAKHEYDRLVDLLVVKLSSLTENVERLHRYDETNRRTESITRKILAEMEEISIDAVSMLK